MNNNSVCFGAIKNDIKDRIAEFEIEPTVVDLGDLFNYEFNQRDSCFATKLEMS
jgi:hypothetical protein